MTATFVVKRSATACLAIIFLPACGGAQSSDVSEREALRAAEVESAVAFQGDVMDCLGEEGWPVRATEGGWGVEYDGPDPGAEVGTAYNQALDRCTEEALPLPVFEPLSEDEIRLIFDLNVEQAACLEAEG